MEPAVYLNGKMVSREEAKISIFDTGFMYGATVYESIRTFKHKPFKLEEHLARLERSLRYIGMDSLISRKEMKGIVEKIISANIDRVKEDDDMWLSFEVTPGEGFPHPLVARKNMTPTVIAYVTSLPYEEYARYYTEGKHAVIADTRNIPPEALDSRAKNRSRLHFFIAKRDGLKRDPDAFAVLLDTRGYISEGTGANVFIVSGDKLYTPSARNILVGISRQTVIELAKKINLPVVETDINLYDAYNADEAFFTTSSYCILPISQFNGAGIGETIPGAWTGRLLDAWSESVGVDIVRQAQKFAKQRANG